MIPLSFFLGLLQAIEVIVFIYLALTSVYVFVFAVASLFPLPKYPENQIPLKRFAILIPCYKEDDVIYDVAREALNQNYLTDRFDVVIIADKFEQATVEKLLKLPIILFNEKFEISTKTRALNHALKHLPKDQYDAVCILDADNIMEHDFLLKMNAALSNGYVAVQGHRIAKNLNTGFAILDAMSEEINNQIFRKGQRVLGLSSALIGSAMAFDFAFFKKLMADIEVVGGFDKEIELRLLSNKYKIEYIPDAIVYDEKVQNVKIFTQQRRRWISAQFHYFGKHFIPATKALIREGNGEYFNKAFQYLQLPRILLLGSLFVLTLTSFLFGIPSHPLYWSISLIVIILALILSIPKSFYTIGTLKALIYLPVGFTFMFLSLLNIRGANKEFIHTKHTYNAFQIKKKHRFHNKS